MSQRSACPYCGNAQYEEENGILVCTNCGRQQEGGLQVADDDADFGTQGKVTRKKVERTKVRITKVYRGPCGYRLYLLAWQHILWRQCHAMMSGSVRAPIGLWDVVKDLWTLRLAKLVHRLDLTKDESTDAVTDCATEDLTTGSGLEETSNKTRTIRLQPKLWDTISLVYLGTLLLQHSMSLSTLYQLIRGEEIPFIRAIRNVPVEISSKLPAEYQLALDTSTIPTAQELQQAVTKLLQGYSEDYGIVIPSLNWQPLLFTWIQALALPIEIYATTKRLTLLIGYNFTYQLPAVENLNNGTQRKKRRSPIATPEVQLISLIVVAMKLLYPFDLDIDSEDQHSVPSNDLLRMRWKAWFQNHKGTSNGTGQSEHQRLTPNQTIETSPNDIIKVSPEALDSYMDWYQSMFALPDQILKTKKTDLESSILNMFPISSLSNKISPDPAQALSSEQSRIDNLVSQAQSQSMYAGSMQQPQIQDPSSEPENRNPHSSQPQYVVLPKLEVLKGTDILFDNDPSKNPITYFHEQAADLACIDVKRLLRAVRYTEKRLEEWYHRQRRHEVPETTQFAQEHDLNGEVDVDT